MPKSDWLTFHRDYSDAMREMVAKYPDDLDAATMFAESLMMLRPWQLWTLDGEPAPGTLELVAVLESVLRRNPNHPGANHFYIHAVEASRNLERAIPSAMRLMTLTPGAGHLVHMPGHIFLQTGDFDLAATDEREARPRRIARSSSARARPGMYPLMYWTHNIHFIAYARAQEGRYEDAKKAALGHGDERRRADGADADARGLPALSAMVDLRFHQWDEILATRSRSQGARSRTRSGVTRARWRLGQGKVRDAAAEQKRFERERAALPAEAMYLLNNKAADLLAAGGRHARRAARGRARREGKVDRNGAAP